MSFHMHLRAVPPAEITVDPAWLEAFMLDAWPDHPEEEDAAGIAASIEKDFGDVNHLYTGAPDGPGDETDASGFPIFGGEMLFRGDEPPMLLQQPAHVAATAAFLGAADFERLWAARGEAISVGWGDPTLARKVCLEHHEALAAFYAQAAAAGHAVIKAFWF